MQAEEPGTERVAAFSRQLCTACVSACERFNWVFNQGVMLSVPIRCSRQGSPAGCFRTTTPSKRQIMIPRSDSENQQRHSSLPLSLSFFLSRSLSPPFHQPVFISLLHIFAPSQIDGVRKWNITMRGRWGQVRVCLVTRSEKTRESNMSRKPIWFSAVSSGLTHVTSHFPRLSDTHAYTHVPCCVFCTAGESTNNNCVVFVWAHTITVCDAHTSFHMSKDIIPVACH